MKITLENNETHDLDMTIDEVKKKLGIEVEWPQRGSVYWFVDDWGVDNEATWDNDSVDNYRLAHGNCSPTREGLDAYKADEAKKAAIVAIRKHRDKTFGVFRQDWTDRNQIKWSGYFDYDTATFKSINDNTCFNSSITVYFATKADIERSFVECAEAWEVLK